MKIWRMGRRCNGKNENVGAYLQLLAVSTSARSGEAVKTTPSSNTSGCQMRQDSRSDETDSIHPTELKISETLGLRDSRFSEFTRWIGVPGRHPGIVSRRGDVNVTEVGHHVTECHVISG